MKHTPGFVPVQFNKMGNIFVILGIILLVMGIWEYLFDIEWINNNTSLFVGLFMIVIGLYLRKYVPKDETPSQTENSNNEKK